MIPKRFRAEWKQEWDAELAHRESRLAEWQGSDWKTRRDLVKRSLSSFWDALAMQPRRLEEDMFQDMKYGTRALLKNKGWTFVVVLSLALGIGANTALFSVIDAVLLRELPVPAPKELVLFEWSSPTRELAGSCDFRPTRNAETQQYSSICFSTRTFESFRDATKTMASVFAFAPIEQLSVAVDGQAEVAFAQFISGDYHRGLGVTAAHGRPILAADDDPASPGAVVISHRYWERKFGADVSAVGKPITLNGNAFTIVGITPAEFSGTLQVGEAPDISIPLAFEPSIRGGDSNLDQPWNWWLFVMGRIQRNATVEQVRAELDPILGRTAVEGWDAMPAATKAEPEFEAPRAIPRLETLPGNQGLNHLRSSYVPRFGVLSIIVGTLLLIVCANVMNLLLARTEVRQREVALRLALGAARLRLIRQFATESLLLAFAGGAAGLLVAFVTRNVLTVWFPVTDGAGIVDVRMDWTVLAFAALLSLATGLVVGLMPAVRFTRDDLAQAIQQASRKVAGSRSLLSRGIVVAQVAMSLVLIVFAGLFITTFRNLQSVDVGFDTENLLLFRINPDGQNYAPPQVVELYDRMIERIDAIPGVTGATISRHSLLAGSSEGNPQFFVHPASPGTNPGSVLIHRVRPNFFEVMGIPLLLGRPLTLQDRRNVPMVAVINEALARAYFPDVNPIGRHFSFQSRSENPIQIVGIVRDTKYTSQRQDVRPTVYVSYLQAGVSQMAFAIRTSRDPESFIPAVRNAVREVDANVPIFDIRTQTAAADQGLMQERHFARSSTAFSLLALTLACVGLYGTMSYRVARRTAEMGVRVALGAQRRNILSLVLGEALLLVGIGIACGVLASTAITRLAEGLLYDLSPRDPWILTSASVLMVAVALLAAYFPSRQASRVDPLVALRHE